MRPFVVVAPHPDTGNLSGQRDFVKRKGVEHLSTKGVVKALDVGILLWLALLDELKFDSVAFTPKSHGLCSEFRSVVHPDFQRFAAPFKELFQFANNALAAQASVDGDHQRFPVKIVNYVEAAEWLARACGVVHEVHTPGDIWHQRLQKWILHSGRKALLILPSQVHSQGAINPVHALVIPRVLL